MEKHTMPTNPNDRGSNMGQNTPQRQEGQGKHGTQPQQGQGKQQDDRSMSGQHKDRSNTPSPGASRDDSSSKR
jgi:hypothetical protein